MRALSLFLLLFVSQLFVQAQDTWKVVAKDIDPDNYFGVTCANGVIGLVSSPEPMKVKDVVMNGVYDYYQRGRVSNILKTFNPLDIDLIVDGTWVDNKSVSDYAQTLDMKKASLETTFNVGKSASITHRMMALRHLPYTSMIIVEIKAHKDLSFEARSVIKAPNHLRDVRQLFSEIDRPHVRFPLMTSVGKSPSGKHTVAVSNSFIFEGEHGSEPAIIHEDWDFDRHWMKFVKELKAGQTYRFAVIASSTSSEQYQDPFNEAERLTIYAVLEGEERLLNRHYAAWEELWESDILIEGDATAQRDVRFMLYHLYSFMRAGTAFSMSPMGLSGLGYNGHVFWDTEIWMYPPLLLLQPDMARSILEYRYQRLEAARQNAFSHGYKGAMFPWESAGDGSEDTPVWALTGPFQHHITGDIGWAAWQYYLVTKDKNWLETRGYPMLKEIATFWTSRVERNGSGQYDINNVIGANEWEENIDNNAYTNGMAITVLRNATAAAKELGLEPDPDWMHVANNIPILTFEDGTTRENATYDGVMIKQADANLLAYPMKIIKGEENIRRDLKYYEPRMSPNGPAMGFSVLATLYARLNEPEKAYRLFNQSYQPNRVPPFGVLAETTGGTNPYFATGAGGTLQTLIYGFGGLEITPSGIQQLETNLPKAWKSITIKGIGIDKQTFSVKQ